MSKRKVLIITSLLLVAAIPVAVYRIMPIRMYPGDPAAAQIHFDDMRSFATAHNAAQANDYAASDYAKGYFDLASDPIESLVWMVEISAESTAEHARDRPKAYAELIERFANIEASEPLIRDTYIQFKEAYPDAVFPPLHFAFSGYRARGLIRPYGIILGAEYFVGGHNDASIEGWYDGRGLVVPIELLPGQLVHELAHIQQARNSPLEFVSSGKVLNWVIFEGAADFVAALITGDHSNPAAHAYLEEKGDAIWCQFYQSTSESRRTYWLDSDIFGVPPGGFASAFGYNIAEAFYEQHDNKREALVELIELSDYDDIYIRSGYPSRLASLCGQ